MVVQWLWKAFDAKGTWSLGNGYVRNVVIFSVDNSLSSHADNHKNNFLVLEKGDTFGINGSFVWQKKYFSTDFNKAKTNILFEFTSQS